MNDNGFIEYIDMYRWHFNRKANEYAISMMYRVNASTGKKEHIEPLSKDYVDDLLTRQGIKLERSHGYDYVYVANMLKSDHWKSAIDDEKHLALAIKDIIDDPDAGDGEVMRCWVAKMYARKEPIFWDELLKPS